MQKKNNKDEGMSHDVASKKTHPFHILDPSPWPILSSLSALVVMIGTVLLMHDHGWYVLAIGVLILVGTLVGWWRDVVTESTTGHHTQRARTGFKYGMSMFILSEVMFFVAFFWAYFNAALSPTEAMGNVWPPKGIQTLDPFGLPYLNTLLLLLSGTTVTWAHYDIVVGDIKGMIQKTGITVLLGFIFLAVQMYEYHHIAFAFKGGIYPSTFFMATGFHGLHVFIGAVFLLVCYLRAKKGHFTKDDHFGFEAAAWYWHFVDVVWLFLFVSIYLWGAAPR